MLKIKFLFIGLFVSLLTVSLNSCSDDDSIDVTTSNLVGTWTLTRTYGWEYEYDDNGNKYKDDWDEPADPEVVETLIFNEDGSGAETLTYKISGHESRYPYRYSISGNKIIFTGDVTLEDKDVTVTTLTKNRLVLKAVDSVSEENWVLTK